MYLPIYSLLIHNSCIRLYAVRAFAEQVDPMYDGAPINMWSCIEINLGIMCACAPALKILVVKLRHRIGGSTSSYRDTRPSSFHALSDDPERLKQRSGQSKSSDFISMYELDERVKTKSGGYSVSTVSAVKMKNPKMAQGYLSDLSTEELTGQHKSRDIIVKTTFETRSEISS